MGLFSSSKSTSVQTTNVSNEYITDSYNKTATASVQALSGFGLSGQDLTTGSIDVFGQSNTSGLTFGRSDGSQIGVQAEGAKLAFGSVGQDFNYAEAGSIQGSSIINKTSGGGGIAFDTGGTSSGSIPNIVYYIAIGVLAFMFFIKK